jgi:hypothetical protein
MTIRTWVMSFAALVLMAGAWRAGVASASRAPLRSAHSEPAWSTPTRMVAVTEQGKLFHDPSCPFIHGPAHLTSGQQALAGGFAPCTRCLQAD